MPITYVHIKWPDDAEDHIYSPSRVIENYFTSEQEITISEFNNICGESLDEASERVAQKFGYACTSAMAEKQRIQKLCKNYRETEKVKITSIK